jgi:hypothetical protein
LKLKNNIVVVFPYRFREFDNNRFEIDCLSHKSDVIVQELMDALHSDFSNAYHTLDKSTHIERYDSIFNWRRKYIETISKSNTKPYVINFVSNTSFKELFVNFVISRSNAITIKYKIPGVITYTDSGNITSKILNKFKFIIKRATFKWLKFTLISIVTRNIGLLICRKNDFTLEINNSSKSPQDGLINANSFDYSMFISHIRKKKSIQNAGDTIVYLDTGCPLFSSDSLLTGDKEPQSIESWYPALVNFFDSIEKSTSKTVVIAAHPKHLYTNENKHYFGNRQIFHGETQKLISESSLVLVTNSTAVSYAVLHAKPIMILLNNEIILDDNILLSESNYLSKTLGSPCINLDDFKKNDTTILPANHEKYNNYIFQYLSSRQDNKTNCEIIYDEILNNFSN